VCARASAFVNDFHPKALLCHRQYSWNLYYLYCRAHIRAW